jgi:hypothetical protein
MVRQYVTGGKKQLRRLPYFAVCCQADNAFLSLQYRTSNNGGMTEVMAPDYNGDGINDLGRIFLKLAYSYSSNNTICSAYMSHNAGTEWVQLGSTITFTGIQLQYHGLAAFSQLESLVGNGNHESHWVNDWC